VVDGAVRSRVRLKIAYSRHYDISFFGVERLHPFDSRKYGRAWRELRRGSGRAMARRRLHVDRPASESELLTAHTPAYLRSLKSSSELAGALEMPVLNRAPNWLLQWRIVRPMRWAVRGTILAAAAAVRTGLAINLSGGYHHAKPSRGEGFCLFNDIAIAIRSLRLNGNLDSAARVVYVDLDAHQGNGVCRQFMSDSSMFIFDMYNREIYPGYDADLQDRIDCNIGLRGGTSGDEYLGTLRDRLPGFLDSAGKSAPVELAIYNAGTDVVADDPLGRLDLTPAHVLARDLYVVEQLRLRAIPTLMLPSGGYTRHSYRLIAATIAELAERFDSRGGC
jgi:histone deacetylase 11